MRAAMEIVAEDGFRAATTAAIAKAAGVAEGTIYRHFQTKDELMVALFRRVKLRTYESAVADYNESASVRERFIHLWKSVFNGYRSRPTEFRFGRRFLESPLIRIEGGEAMEAMTGVFDRLRRDGIKAGEVKDLPLDLLAQLFYAPIGGLLRTEIDQDRQWTDEEIDAAAAASWNSWEA